MRKIIATVLAGLISTALGWCEDSPEKEKTVAVCEFEVTGPKDVDADWIGQGVPDLLQIELQDHGISLLDRDFVASVLREQRREASGVMDGRNRVGGLLGARILVEGEAKIEGKQILLSATAATVPENEIIATSSAEGEYPKAVNKLIERLGKELGTKLAQYTHSTPTSQPVDRYIPSPEVMILFHRALDLYSRGFPAASAAWFNLVTRADPLFESAKIWEVKAYGKAGFEGHARVAARKHSMQGKRDPKGEGNKSNPLKVVRIMTPQVSEGLRQQGYDAQAICQLLEDQILEDESVRLFDGETLENVVAELDLQLADGFARRTMPRYDQWLAVDAILTSRRA